MAGTRESSLETRAIGDFLADLAAKRPTPGGGAATALAAALAAALAEMVRSYTDSELPLEAGAEAELRARCLDLASADAEAFGLLSTAYRLPRDTPEDKLQRREAIQLGLRRATEVPLRLADACLDILRVADTLAQKGNRNLTPDAEAAALLAEAALLAVGANVRGNLATLKDETFRSEAEHRYRRACEEGRRLKEATLTHAAARHEG